MSAVSEAHDAYLQMRADGEPLTIAAAVLGVDEATASGWEALDANRRERVGKASDRTAERLMRAVTVADVATIRGIRDELDPERTFAMAVALAVRAIGGAADCVCGHLDLFHNISGKGERTRCDWHEGPQGTPCGCKRFTEPAPEEAKASKYERVGYHGPGSERTAEDVERRHEEFALLRAAGVSTVEAARRMHVSARTGVRYEEKRLLRAERGAA